MAQMIQKMILTLIQVMKAQETLVILVMIGGMVMTLRSLKNIISGM